VEHIHGDLNHYCLCNNLANKTTTSLLNKYPTLKSHLYHTKKKKNKNQKKKRINFPILISGAMNVFRSSSSTSISSSLLGIESKGPTKSAIKRKNIKYKIKNKKKRY
jgi:hypothetical protein